MAASASGRMELWALASLEEREEGGEGRETVSVCEREMGGRRSTSFHGSEVKVGMHPVPKYTVKDCWGRCSPQASLHCCSR